MPEPNTTGPMPMAIILRVFKGTTIVDYHAMLHTNTNRNFAGRRADTAKGRVRSPATGRVVYSPGGVRDFLIIPPDAAWHDYFKCRNAPCIMETPYINYLSRNNTRLIKGSFG